MIYVRAVACLNKFVVEVVVVKEEKLEKG